MIRVLRDFRLLPLVLFAAVALLALKSLGLVFDGAYILGSAERETAVPAPAAPDEAGDIVGSIGTPAKPAPAVPEAPPVTAPLMPATSREGTAASRQSWAQEMFNFPDITGSVGPAKKDAPPAGAAPPTGKEGAAAPPARTAARDPGEKPVGAPEQRPVSPSERAILERLQERRKDLEARARELDMRESLLKAAEKRLDGRVTEIKQTEERTKTAADKKDEEAATRFKSLVSMYENMKAKDAARIFDRLDLKILVDVAGQINPRRMADILANMSPEAAERLTVEFASRGGTPKAPSPADLPKIEGRPNAPMAPEPPPAAKP